MVPTLVENSNFFVYLFVNYFCKTKLLCGEPMHTTLKERNGVAQSSYQLSSEK